ncbi:ABC transporter substrate-binding protein [Dyadobacter sp. 32]|uniref:ABC transporter substrate-binding protein n=1 Tax=Dyadobacter sp. 32 TaxID=538966 RepID=UPI0011EEB104
MITNKFLASTKALWPLCFLILNYGCRSKTETNNSALNASDSSFYADQIQIKHAKGFTIDYFDHYKVVKIISPFEKTADTTRYILLERGAKKPEGYSDSKLIEIPVRSLVAMSSMHVGLLGFLESYHVLTGLGNLQYVYAPEVIKMIQKGKVGEVGRDQGLNEEKLVNMHPDLVMTMGSAGGGMGHYKLLEDAGIPVMINSEWVENNPLARAEWVKLLAALLNKEELVNKKFTVLENEYNRLKTLAATANNKPTIISGLNTKDTWFMPSGDSYMAQFFRDAAADYPWSAQKAAGSLSLSFEAVYPDALRAEYWMNVGFDSKDTKKSILALDARYADFKAFKSGQIYSYNNRVNEAGSNDFFESGNVNPQTVLADLIKILHPNLLPEHELVYYKKLE